MATNNTLIMTSQHLKDNTIINNNVDTELLTPSIIIAENKYIEPALGTSLFNQVVDAIQNNTVSGVTETLLNDYIQPALLHWSLYEALPWLNYKATNKAVSTKDSDNSEPAELNEVLYLRANVKDTAEYMGQRLIAYLCANTTLYPNYLNGNNDIDDINAVRTQYSSGIYLGGNGIDCSTKGLGLGIDLR